MHTAQPRCEKVPPRAPGPRWRPGRGVGATHLLGSRFQASYISSAYTEDEPLRKDSLRRSVTNVRRPPAAGAAASARLCSGRGKSKRVSRQRPASAACTAAGSPGAESGGRRTLVAKDAARAAENAATGQRRGEARRGSRRQRSLRRTCPGPATGRAGAAHAAPHPLQGPLRNAQARFHRPSMAASTEDLAPEQKISKHIRVGRGARGGVTVLPRRTGRQGLRVGHGARVEGVVATVGRVRQRGGLEVRRHLLRKLPRLLRRRQREQQPRRRVVRLACAGTSELGARAGKRRGAACAPANSPNCSRDVVPPSTCVRTVSATSRSVARRSRSRELRWAPPRAATAAKYSRGPSARCTSN